MLDRPLRKIVDPWLELPAGALSSRGVSANAITVGGFALGMAGCVAIALGQYSLGLGLILLNRLADGVDGCVARQRGATELGGFLDIVLDMIFYSGVPLAFAIADPARLASAAALVYSFTGTGGSFLAFAVISAKRGVQTDIDGKKSFFYSMGLMEGSETILFFVLFCLLPGKFATLAWVFCGLCWLTTLLRIAMAVRVFRSVPKSQEAGTP